jgi:hypothetical protein
VVPVQLPDKAVSATIPRSRPWMRRLSATKSRLGYETPATASSRSHVKTLRNPPKLHRTSDGRRNVTDRTPNL